jgi:hypothetical protein
VDLARLIAPWNQAEVGADVSRAADSKTIIRLAKAERGTLLADSTSGELLKYRNGLVMATSLVRPRNSARIPLTTTRKQRPLPGVVALL